MTHPHDHHTTRQDQVHDHDKDHDEDHDHDDEPGPLELNPLWQQDNVTLHSVGVDVGSAGTQLAFSRLLLRRRAESLTSRYIVEERVRLFETEVHLTPYADDQHIDAVRLGEILDQAYADAGLVPEDIDTGVVILTGEALRRRNAELIAAVVAERAGDLVCATAGHHMEAALAAFGSGAARLSRDLGRVLNIDIGGGTTKLSLLEKGRLVQTAALHVGGRLQVQSDGVITRLEPAGRGHAAAAGFDWYVGDRIEDDQLDEVARGMAQAVVDAVTDRPLPERVRRLFLTEPISDLGRLDGVVFSGGVAEFVYGRETRDFGDLGRALGAEIRRHVDAGRLSAPVLAAPERIRATVLGASQYSVQLSGITSHVEDADRTLPRRNLQVVRPDLDLAADVDAAAVAEAVHRCLANFDLRADEDDFALALSWSGDPEFSRLHALAQGLATGLAVRICGERPLYLMVDADIARTLGAILRRDLGVTNDLLILDGIELRDFDYVDLGRVREASGTVPVTIKSLVFSTEGVL